MLYREAGQFKTSYGADQAIFAIRQDRVALALFGVVAVLAVPVLASNYFLETIFVPFLVFAVAALGLNILTGYCGQLSLGTGGFMACGAFFSYKLAIAFPELHLLETGRASCRERMCPYGEISGVAVSLKHNNVTCT